MTRTGRLPLALLLLPALACWASPPLSGRWISSEIDARHSDHLEPRIGWELRLGPGDRFRIRRDEGFSVVAERAGTYRIEDDRLVLRLDRLRGAPPREERYRAQRVGESLVLSNDALHLVLLRSRQPHAGLAQMPAWPKSVDEAVAVLRQLIPREELDRVARMRRHWFMLSAYFGLGLWVRNAFGLWYDNQPLWDDIRRREGADCSKDALYDGEYGSGVILDALWRDLTADLRPPGFRTDDPDRYFVRVAGHLAAAWRRDDRRALLSVPIWLLKDRAPHMAEHLEPLPAEQAPGLLARAEALAATEGPLTHLALLFLSEYRRDEETVALLRRHQDADRRVLWPTPRSEPYDDHQYLIRDHVDDVDDYAWSWVPLGRLARDCLLDLQVEH